MSLLLTQYHSYQIAQHVRRSRDLIYCVTMHHSVELGGINEKYCISSGPGSVVGIATGYGLDGPGIESRLGGGEIFRTCPDRPWGPPSLLYNGYRVFHGDKERPGHDADPLLHSSTVVVKE